MTLKNLYDAIGASYDDTIERLMSADFLLRFVRKFPDDPSFAALKVALARGSTEEAFRAAHTLKGVCANLGFTRLRETAAQLTELLRAGTLEGTEPLFLKLSEEYAHLLGQIALLD